jgi:predicted transcriptional regulator of viral defense system
MTPIIADPSADRSLEKLREEYESMAGLRLTVTQVARLLDIDQEYAALLLGQLEAEGVLLATAGGVYRRSAPLLS